MERSTTATQMHERIYGEPTPPQTALPLIMALLENNLLKPEVPEAQLLSEKATSLLENDELQLLIDEANDQLAIINDDTKEQATARKLLILFGIPFMEGAHAVWKTIVEFLDDAKEASFIAQQRLEAIVTQIRTKLVFILINEEENALETLTKQERQHQQGMPVLQQTQASLIEENLPAEHNQEAIQRKNNHLITIEKQKNHLKNSIESLKAMVSNLLIGLSRLNQFDQTSMVMA